MAYDDERPADWTSYDNVASASDNLRFILNMRGIPEQLRLVLGPENFKRAIELLDCIDKRLQEMGTIGLGWASTAMDRALEGREGGAGTDRDVAILDAMEKAVEAGEINKAWNIAEKWAKKVDISEMEDE